MRRVELASAQRRRARAKRSSRFWVRGSMGRGFSIFSPAAARVGCEALSRGAAESVFVERDPRAVAALNATIEELALAERATVLCGDAITVASRLRGRFDLVFADPPFDQSAPCQALVRLREQGCVDAETIVIYERRHSSPPLVCQGWERERTERYGEVALEFVRLHG